MRNDILELTEKLIPVSDFSKGKTAQIFDDVKKNNAEYIVLKNNQPTALLISLENYRALSEKAAKMEELLDRIEEERLQVVAEERIANGMGEMTPFSEIIHDAGFTEEEIYAHMDEVEIE